MTIYMLHFACTPPGSEDNNEKWTANSCAVSNTLSEAEENARQSISARGYKPGELIAYSEHGEAEVSSFGEMEATLYLKAQQNRPPCAVLFSEWSN